MAMLFVIVKTGDLVKFANENLCSSLKLLIKQHHTKLVSLHGSAAYIPKMHFLEKNRGTLRSNADVKALVSSSLNSGYYPCQLMSPEECNEQMGRTEVRLMGTRVSP